MINSPHLRKVILEVKGGLGNQMFQYAAARSLSLDLNAELVIEKKLGFFLDLEYKRKFELNKLSTVFSISSLTDSFPFYIERINSYLKRHFKLSNSQGQSRNHFFERNFSYINLEQVDRIGKRFWMSGYFQDPRYFEAHKKEVFKELAPPKPTEQKYLDLAKLSGSFNLIALGIRIFEESSAPEVHAREGVNKTLADFQHALSKLLDSVSNPLILVFTTREFDFLKSMNLPVGTIFVNTERGFDDTISKLWLLTMCQHHVFNNSTFYWWGATLSQLNFVNTQQKIYCSDNFLNPSIVYPNWTTF